MNIYLVGKEFIGLKHPYMPAIEGPFGRKVCLTERLMNIASAFMLVMLVALSIL
jgi:hypothetical protein